MLYPPIMPTPIASVLNTTELLEQILLFLPERDLLVHAQRVNRSFRTLITSSPSLQQKLFFKRIPSRGPDGDDKHCTWHANPLLLAAFPPMFTSSQGKWNKLRGNQVYQNLDWQKESKAEAYKRREASWRRMLVSQPPVSRLYVTIAYRVRGSTRKERFKFELPDGLYMGMLYDLVRDNVRSEADMLNIEWYAPEVDSDSDFQKGEDEPILPEADLLPTDTYIMVRVQHTVQFARLSVPLRTVVGFESEAHEMVELDAKHMDDEEPTDDSDKTDESDSEDMEDSEYSEMEEVIF